MSWKDVSHQLYDVKEIQERLKVHGFDPGPIDGEFGPQTDKAIRDYQESALKIGRTGLIGPWAMSELRKAKQPS